ncbi:L,D-transpeptidase family protein [Accumulibacter sp.]|uniref:L,D-transpeptidase family protein n=1 Tax=Accumulibacter sp. TaxID=2053492 RepID=UPI0025FB9B42|nr:L,D-transpeptidase family protein [Accumulibacter sp.]MCP5229974.1 L,D-transpeptidase family protein [Accumulibacter sp.]
MSIVCPGKAVQVDIVPDVALPFIRSLRRVAAATFLGVVFSPVPAQAIEESRPLPLRSAALSTPTQAAAELPRLIEQALYASDGDAGAGNSTEAAVIRLFYYDRGYRPVWTGNAHSSELITAIEASREHGLTPSDFHVDALRKAVAGGDDPQAIVRRELLLTDALAQLVRQLQYGKIDPGMLYSTWNFSPLPDVRERAQALEALFEAGSLSTALATLTPQDADYRGLQKALLRFSALAAKGGWGSVPDGPTLRPGERDPRVRSLRARLQAEGWLAADGRAASRSDAARYDKALAAAVKRFQSAHGLAADGAVGTGTLAALNVSAAERAAQIRVNLERWRWVARDLTADLLLVDITAFNAELHLGGEPVWSSKVAVGRPARKTPVLLDHVQHLVLNPKWVVPPTILREDVIPGVMRNAAYLDKHQLRVVNNSGQAVSPAQVNWSGYGRAGFPYQVVQQSGAGGALGRIKFSLSNGYAIYLHDTPSRAQFNKPTRALSSGCVRLEKPRDLALLLLDDAQRWNEQALDAAIASQRTRTVPVAREVPVMLLYRTALADATGSVSFRADIYDEDGAVLALLDRPSRWQP